MSASDPNNYTPPKATLKQRRVMHFGFEFLYGSNVVDPSRPLPGGLPGITHPLLDRMMERGLVNKHPDQLTVNQYNPGAGLIENVSLLCHIRGSLWDDVFLIDCLCLPTNTLATPIN